MPVRREGRNVVASPDELNQWLQRTSGEEGAFMSLLQVRIS